MPIKSKDPKTCPYYETAERTAQGLVFRYRNLLANDGYIVSWDDDKDHLVENITLALLDAYESGTHEERASWHRATGDALNSGDGSYKP